MNRKRLITGMVCIAVGTWIYLALSSFTVEENTFPVRLIIKEGTARTEVEVAEALAREKGFDLEGAYRSGYTARDVAQYLMQEPHELSVTSFRGTYYQDRRTIPKFIPLGVCILLIAAGVILVFLGFKSGKSRTN